MVDVERGEVSPEMSAPADLRAALEGAQRREGELRSAISAPSILLGGVRGVLGRAGLAGDADDFLFTGVTEAARTIQETALRDLEVLPGAVGGRFSPEAFEATVALVREVARAVEREPPARWRGNCDGVSFGHLGALTGKTLRDRGRDGDGPSGRVECRKACIAEGDVQRVAGGARPGLDQDLPACG